MPKELRSQCYCDKVTDEFTTNASLDLLNAAIQERDVKKTKFIMDDVKTDLGVYGEILYLKNQVEQPGRWASLTEQATAELDQLPADALSQLILAYQYFIKDQPASHSKAHFSRDSVHLYEILNCMPPGTVNDVDLVVGIIAGEFHDGGTAIVERHSEPTRLARHAEVGAHLLGILGRDILPPHILQMSQYAIAAHTNYLTPQKTTRRNGRDAISTTITPYQWHDKAAAQIAQASDRGDITSSIVVPRHLIGFMKNGYIYGADGFHMIDPKNEVDYRALWSCDATAPHWSFLSVLEKLGKSAEPDSDHTKHDPDWLLQNYIRPHGEGLSKFTRIVRGTEPNDSDIDPQMAFTQFVRLCRLLEPGIDINEKVPVMATQFSQIADTDQKAWARGFHALTTDIYPTMHKRMKQQTQGIPKGIEERNAGVQNMIRHLQHTASDSVSKEVDKSRGID